MQSDRKHTSASKPPSVQMKVKLSRCFCTSSMSAAIASEDSSTRQSADCSSWWFNTLASNCSCAAVNPRAASMLLSASSNRKTVSDTENSIKILSSLTVISTDFTLFTDMAEGCWFWFSCGCACARSSFSLSETPLGVILLEEEPKDTDLDIWIASISSTSWIPWQASAFSFPKSSKWIWLLSLCVLFSFAGGNAKDNDVMLAVISSLPSPSQFSSWQSWISSSLPSSCLPWSEVTEVWCVLAV